MKPMTPMTPMTSSARRLVGVIGVAAVAVALLVNPLDPATATPPSTSTTFYATSEPVCAAPASPTAFRCMSMRRVRVAKGTTNARAYVVPTGPSAVTHGPADGLTPRDLATAYGFNSTATGGAQTVAIVDAFNDPRINADLQTFDKHYGLRACTTSNGCLRVVNQHGGTTLPANDTTGWSGEIALDVETVHSVCQKCHILLVEANSESDGDLSAAENTAARLHATEISNSYGKAEDDLSVADASAYNHPGIVITAAAGDDGYFDYDDGSINEPEAPASLNTVVAVGGTSLHLRSTGARSSETVWNDNGPQESLGHDKGATGGGCSTMHPAPLWQSRLTTWASTACGGARLVSDVSAVGDYLTGFDTYSSYACSGCHTGWQTIGGTSLSAPIIAAMFALAGGAHGVAHPARSLYAHRGSKSLYDVTQGGNGYCAGLAATSCANPNGGLFGGGIRDCAYTANGTPSAGVRACTALPGYDGPTGLGTPNGLGAFALALPTARLAGPGTVRHGTARTWTAHATDPFPGGAVVSYTWRWGDGTRTVTSKPKATHRYRTHKGGRSIRLTVRDNYQASRTVTRHVRVS
jgi:subtilase family serine protease